MAKHTRVYLVTGASSRALTNTRVSKQSNALDELRRSTIINTFFRFVSKFGSVERKKKKRVTFGYVERSSTVRLEPWRSGPHVEGPAASGETEMYRGSNSRRDTR